MHKNTQEQIPHHLLFRFLSCLWLYWPDGSVSGPLGFVRTLCRVTPLLFFVLFVLFVYGVRGFGGGWLGLVRLGVSLGGLV